jgi:hypothetical protein
MRDLIRDRACRRPRRRPSKPGNGENFCPPNRGHGVSSLSGKKWVGPEEGLEEDVSPLAVFQIAVHPGMARGPRCQPHRGVGSESGAYDRWIHRRRALRRRLATSLSQADRSFPWQAAPLMAITLGPQMVGLYLALAEPLPLGLRLAAAGCLSLSIAAFAFVFWHVRRLPS